MQLDLADPAFGVQGQLAHPVARRLDVRTTGVRTAQVPHHVPRTNVLVAARRLPCLSCFEFDSCRELPVIRRAAD